MKNFISIIVLNAALCSALCTAICAADVVVRLSSREAYVGSPIILQIEISDAASYEQPSEFSIADCDVRSAGAPAESTQITIMNGRRSESRSVTLQYLITPRREGTFQIPEMTFQVDGEDVKVQSQSFVATTSETGDLLFVGIEGSKAKVFVGEPLELTLNVWIKPFRDTKSGQTLSEGAMWSLISESTSWGIFAERMNELAANRQRPGGQEVLRDDGSGNERAYYLYQVQATIYPKRSGKIDASDVQIVVNYPTAMGRSRSPFGNAFDDDGFGGGSVISRMFDDDGFGPSLGRRMIVTASRPIVGEVNVDATEVLPVPLEGRPADYRGAVGKYRIVTQATPTTVDAGDPITLNIGIAGSGPMELVQAPPLSEQVNLTNDFKVADDALAGFVKDDTKVFSTTIRPRRDGIESIPAIKFSFFDPDTAQFQTVYSEPIAITVNKSETLVLDSVVSSLQGTSKRGEVRSMERDRPDFTNYSGESILTTQVAAQRNSWWRGFVWLPPLMFIAIAFARLSGSMVASLFRLRSEKSKCLSGIETAKEPEVIAAAIATFVLHCTSDRPAVRPAVRLSKAGSKADNLAITRSSLSDRESRETAAVGRLRIEGLYQLASELESFLERCHGEDVQSLVGRAGELVQKLDDALQANRRHRVATKLTKATVWKAASQSRLLIGIVVSSMSVAVAFADDVLAKGPQGGMKLPSNVALKMLAEATEVYDQGIAKQASDAADAKDCFLRSSVKYQMLVDYGFCNAKLFTNLGNACFQAGELGRAIANYEKALLLEPTNSQASMNLAFANQKVVRDSPRENAIDDIRVVNQFLVGAVGLNSVQTTVAASSVAFWGILTLKVFKRSFPVWRCAAIPLSLLMVSTTSMVLTAKESPRATTAIIVSNQVILYSGDGEDFAEVTTMESAEGHRVDQLASRGLWVQIRTNDGHVGWVHSRDIETLLDSVEDG